MLLAGVGTLGLSAILARSHDRPLGHRVVCVASSAVAVAAAAITLLTRGVVTWDQLALSSVTVGSDISGYWTAAFDYQVLFVLVDGTEESRSEYALALVAHLASPVGGLDLASICRATEHELL